MSLDQQRHRAQLWFSLDMAIKLARRLCGPGCPWPPLCQVPGSSPGLCPAVVHTSPPLHRLPGCARAEASLGRCWPWVDFDFPGVKLSLEPEGPSQMILTSS